MRTASSVAHRRGKRFEDRVAKLLRSLAAKHPEAVRVRLQPVQRLLNEETTKPDCELVYVLDQEHHELIELQSRNRTSTAIADKIKKIKALSHRNRFVFVFEDGDAIGAEHQRILEADGVLCLTFEEFERKLAQLDTVLAGLKKGLAKKDYLKNLADALSIASFVVPLFVPNVHKLFALLWNGRV